MELEIKTRESKDYSEVSVIELNGALDFENVPKINMTFNSLIDNGVAFAVLDMAGVEVISSAAFGEILGFRASLVEKEGDLFISGLSIEIKEKLSSLGGNKIFSFYPDIRSAINAFRWKHKNGAESVTLKFPSSLKYVPAVRQLVSRISILRGYDRRDSFRVETIVDEVCNNAVEHGAKEGDQAVKMSCMIDSNKIDLKVMNKSAPDKLDSLKKISEALSIKKKTDDGKRGRGLTLVKMLSNKFSIDYSDEGTCVHVTKARED